MTTYVDAAASRRLLEESNASVARRNAAQAEAERAAYLATPAGRAEAAAAAREAEQLAFADAIMSLPEAKERPRAARRLVMAYSANSMPVARAKLMLAGLPAEPADLPTNTNATTTNRSKTTMADDTILRRKAELKLAALNLRADQGDNFARQDANKVRYALQLNAQGMTMSDALSASGVSLANFAN